MEKNELQEENSELQEETEENYDFYSMGKRYSNDILVDISSKVKEIEEEYGIDAKLEFESGIATSVLYFQGYEDIASIPKGKIIKGVSDYGMYEDTIDSYTDESQKVKKLV